MRVLTIAFLLAATTTAAFGSFVGEHAAPKNAVASAAPVINNAAVPINGALLSSSSSVSVAEVEGDEEEWVGHGAAYDKNMAMEGVFYSKAAFCPADQIANWKCASCGFIPAMKEVKVFTARDTQAYVGYNSAKNVVVVTIRGSANPQNWIDNLTFELVPHPACSNVGCKVHKGFYEIYKALAGTMIPYVKQALARHPTASIFVTGHSLGGAISTLAALEIFASTKNTKLNVYNFGEPRVGNPAFARHAATALPAKQQFRIVHKADPVPHLPPTSFGYLHVPQEIFYDHDTDKTWVACKDSVTAEDKACSTKYKSPTAFADHKKYLGVAMGCPVTQCALDVFPYVDLQDHN